MPPGFQPPLLWPDRCLATSLAPSHQSGRHTWTGQTSLQFSSELTQAHTHTQKSASGCLSHLFTRSLHCRPLTSLSLAFDHGFPEIISCREKLSPSGGICHQGGHTLGLFNPTVLHPQETSSLLTPCTAQTLPAILAAQQYCMPKEREIRKKD